MQSSGLSSRGSRLGPGAQIPTAPAEQPQTVNTETHPGPDSPFPPPIHLDIKSNENYMSPPSQGDMGTNDWRKKSKYTTQY